MSGCLPISVPITYAAHRIGNIGTCLYWKQYIYIIYFIDLICFFDRLILNKNNFTVSTIGTFQTRITDQIWMYFGKLRYRVHKNNMHFNIVLWIGKKFSDLLRSIFVVDDLSRTVVVITLIARHIFATDDHGECLLHLDDGVLQRFIKTKHNSRRQRIVLHSNAR